MPSVRKLTPHEVQTLEHKGKGQRKLVAEQYDAFLADYAPGDHGEAELEENEKRLTVQNRFKAAAKRRGIKLIFQRTRGTALRFKVAPASAQSASPPVASGVRQKGRGGRRKAAVAPAQ